MFNLKTKKKHNRHFEPVLLCFGFLKETHKLQAVSKQLASIQQTNRQADTYKPLAKQLANGTEEFLANCNHNWGLESMGGQLISCDDTWCGVPPGSLCY